MFDNCLARDMPKYHISILPPNSAVSLSKNLNALASGQYFNKYSVYYLDTCFQQVVHLLGTW